MTAIIDKLINSLPDPKQLTSEERRGIIARYASVLEGNFIYWMTAAVIAAKAEQSRPILLENLYEEVHDCHPLMLPSLPSRPTPSPPIKTSWPCMTT